MIKPMVRVEILGKPSVPKIKTGVPVAQKLAVH